MRRLRSPIAALCAVALLAPAVARADGDAPQPDAGNNAPTDKKQPPWAVGVSAEDQKIASQLFKEGNGFLRDSNYNDALAKYREAIKHWDHPAIYYNMALALLNVGEATEIYASLQHATKWGVEGLGKEQFDAAQTYLKLVEQQIVHITVSCTEPGAEVFVDGKKTLSCPGKSDPLVLKAGEHSFAATKAGFETTTVDKVYPGGQTEQIDLKLYRVEELTKYRRKFAPWLTYTVIGAGVVVAGIGGLIDASASSDMKSFDKAIADCGGCKPSSDLLSKRDGAKTKQVIGFIGYGIGAAAVAAGVAMVIINRPQPYRVDSESREPKGIAVVPVIDSHGVGVSASLHF